MIASPIKLLAFFILCPLAIASVALASATDGTIDPNFKYAWSDKMGWINFAADQGNIHVTDAALTGYAWSSNYGWINLSPTNSGQGVVNDSEGNLSGYAWAANAGFINFSNVKITSSGKFTGTATGNIAGTLTFDCTNCDVRTDWRPASVRQPPAPSPSPSGGDAGGGGYIVVTPIAEVTPATTTILPTPISVLSATKSLSLPASPVKPLIAKTEEPQKQPRVLFDISAQPASTTGQPPSLKAFLPYLLGPILLFLIFLIYRYL